MTKLNKTLINDIAHVKTQLSNSITDLKENIGKYTNVGTYINSNVSNLGDLDKAIACEKMGIKVLKFKANNDNPKKPKSSDYVFVHGFSNDIFSCLNNLGKFCNAQVSEDLIKKFSLKVGKKKSTTKKSLAQLFVEKFFIRNSYISIKNGNTNLNKSYEIIDGVIVTKKKKDKNNNSKNDNSKNEENDNENYLTFKFVDSLVNNESYSKLNAIQIKEVIDQFTSKLLEDNDYTIFKFKDEIASLNLPKIKNVSK